MRLYVDPQSPYAYLAESRAAAVLGRQPELVVVTLGPIFARRGHGSWAHGPEHAAHVAEIEARAVRYGLPPMAWPPGWPAPSLAPARAATWAAAQGAARPYLRALWQRTFAGGAPLEDPEVLAGAAEDAGLDRGAVAGAIAAQAVKDALRAATDGAWERGVRGVPTLEAGDGTLLYGDDRLEQAARA